MTQQLTLFPDNAEYDAFIGKFVPKKTTDDCYTPPNIYQVVADWVAEEYGLDKTHFLRPFKPGGDYEKEKYPSGYTVVDNPPFSILAKIVRFYAKNDIPFFMFCPALTPPWTDNSTIIAVGASIVYENGASVPTSFVTNLEPGIILRTAPCLYRSIELENKQNLAATRRTVPTYTYPDHVVTAAIAQRFSKYGIEYAVRRADAVIIQALDEQRTAKKSIFGGGLLLSDKAAVEKAAVEKAAVEKAAVEKAKKHVWKLSTREIRIVRGLNAGGD